MYFFSCHVNYVCEIKITYLILILIWAHAKAVRRGGQGSASALGISARGGPYKRSSCQSQPSTMTIDSLLPGIPLGLQSRPDPIRAHPAYRIKLRKPRHAS